MILKTKKFQFENSEVAIDLKKIYYFQNKKKNRPNAVVCLIANRHPKLSRTISLGLCSYGIDVILLKQKKKQWNSNSDAIDYMGIKKFLSSTIFKLTQEKKTEVQIFFICINNDFKIFKNIIDQFSQKNEILLINPKINKNLLNVGAYQKYNFRNYIFSEKSTIFQNRRLKNFLNYGLKEKNIIIIDKSRKYFKYRESILLGIIINIYENTILN